MLIAIVVATIIGGILLLPVRQYLVDALEWTQGLGAWGPIFVSLFYIVACVLLLPGSVLTLGAGFLFGVPLGLLSAWTGATLGACAAFLVGRTLARDWVAGKVSGNPKFTAVDEAVGIVEKIEMTKVSFGKYALASLIVIHETSGQHSNEGSKSIFTE